MTFEKLTIDNKDKTKIMAGHLQFKIDELEHEAKTDSDMGKKLKEIEKILERDY